jgi:hypothetical protein
VELVDDHRNRRKGSLMATVTYVRTIKFVAEILEEDPELLQAIVSNDDNLSYGSIISVYTGDDESVTALTDDGMDELEQMLKDARRTSQEWNDFLDSFVDDELLVARIKSKIAAVAIGRLLSVRKAPLGVKRANKASRRSSSAAPWRKRSSPRAVPLAISRAAIAAS